MKVEHTKDKYEFYVENISVKTCSHLILSNVKNGFYDILFIIVFTFNVSFSRIDE